MNRRIITIEVLTPNDGCYLTQANRGENDEPIMSNEVINGKEEDWVNIPIEEGDRIVAEWQAEQEKRMQEEMNNATR
jgi:hypothetical protein